MLKSYADVHVVFAIVQALRRRGMDVVTAEERGREEAEDAGLLTEALARPPPFRRPLRVPKWLNLGGRFQPRGGH